MFIRTVTEDELAINGTVKFMLDLQLILIL